MTTNELLAEITRRLRAEYGSRLHGVVLYGSEARGDARPDSDIDLLVLLEGPVEYGRDLEANLDALYPLSVDLGRRLSAKPVEAAQYERAECPLYRLAREEGLAV